jgi:hypothetical protein
MRMLRSWPIKIPNMNKMRQMTSCVHKMCGRTYGQTNMKRAITRAKINYPWNRYNMRMLRSWPSKIPICHDLSMRILYRFHGWLIFARVNSPFHVCLTIRLPGHFVYTTSRLSFVAFYSYLVSWLAMHDLSMRILYQFQGWFSRKLSSWYSWNIAHLALIIITHSKQKLENCWQIITYCSKFLPW